MSRSSEENSSACMCHQWKNMGDFAIRGQLSSKTIGGKEFVTVVVLDNLSYSFQGHCICIHLVRTHIMEGSGLRGIPWEEHITQYNKFHLINIKCIDQSVFVKDQLIFAL